MRRSKAESGASAVEFALILPLLLSVLFFSIDFAWMFYADIQITNAARDAARYGAAAPAGEVEAAAKARGDYVLGQKSPGITGSYDVRPECNFPELTVEVTYNFEPLVGFIELLQVNLFRQIKASATMNVENGTGC